MLKTTLVLYCLNCNLFSQCFRTILSFNNLNSWQSVFLMRKVSFFELKWSLPFFILGTYDKHQLAMDWESHNWIQYHGMEGSISGLVEGNSERASSFWLETGNNQNEGNSSYSLFLSIQISLHEKSCFFFFSFPFFFCYLERDQILIIWKQKKNSHVFLADLLHLWFGVDNVVFIRWHII